MGLFDRLFKSQQTHPETEQRSYEGPVFGTALQYNGWSSFKTGQSMTLSAVNRCVSVIKDSVASLPVKVYMTGEDGYKRELDTRLSYLLSRRPNAKMNSYTFYSLIVKDILLAGNAYALIVRSGDEIVSLQYIQPGLVSPIDKDDHIEYLVTGIKNPVRQEDILHFMGYTDNGVFGISVLTQARRALELADAGDRHASNFFKTGASSSGFLKFTGPSNEKQKEEILSSWNQATGSTNGLPSGIPVLPCNVDYTQLSISPADAQLLESRQFSVVEICRFFNVSPVKVFDMSHASYSNSEQAELSFLNDTLRPLLVKIENELETKLFPDYNIFDIKFDVSELLRADKKSQSEYFAKMFQLGVLSPNDIRKQLDLTPVEGGDIYVAQVNLTSIKNLETINATADNRQKENYLTDDKENTED